MLWGVMADQVENKRKTDSGMLLPSWFREMNPVTLSFPSHRERQYRERSAAESVWHVRLAAVVGMFLVCVMGTVEIICSVAPVDTVWWVRYGVVCCVALGGVLAATFTRMFIRHDQLIVSLGATIGGLGMMTIGVLSLETPGSHAYAEVMLAQMFIYMCIRLRWVWATAVGWTVTLSYIVARGWMSPGAVQDWLTELAFLATGNVVGMFAAYFSEMQRRTVYTSLFQLEVELEKAGFARELLTMEVSERRVVERRLEQHRLGLEQLVNERTADLTRANDQLRQEIVHRQHAEENHMRLAVAVEQAAEMVVIIGMDRRIEYVNAAWEKQTGYDRASCLGRNWTFDGQWSVLVGGEALLGEIEGAMSGGRIWSGRLKGKRHDGGVCELDVAISPVRSNQGQLVNYVFVMRDVSQQMQMEMQLREAQRLESIGQLASGIAHEINTPMQYVGNNITFLRDRFGEIQKVLDEYMKLRRRSALMQGEGCGAIDVEYLLAECPAAIEESLDGVSRVTQIVRAMKTFSHPGVEGKTGIDINEALETTLTVARNEWKYVADIERDYDRTLPAVECLAGEMNQVFLNLIINAVHAIEDARDKASGEKGVIHVSTHRDGLWVEVRIGDSGVGIPEEIQRRIFDPFFTTKEVGRGTGQGLAIVRSVVVEKHGGVVTFESEVGKGTTFIVRLPICAPESLTAEEQTETTGLAAGRSNSAER